MNKAFEIARGEYGQREIPGRKHNPKILEYFKKVGHSWVHDDETAWCAAFVGWCLEMAGITSTRKLNARSYLKWGKKLLIPKKGCLVIFWRGSKWGWQGHVGFYEGETVSHIKVLGGNQSDGVNIQEYPRYQFLGYREVPNETPITTLTKTEKKAKIIEILNSL